MLAFLGEPINILAMRRLAETDLKAWLSSDHRKPLVLRGARQVGKSTLVRRVAADVGMPLWEVNLERFPVLESAFESKDTSRILLEIGLVLRKTVGQEAGILFLDEIQAIPSALAALRYLHEDRPDLPVVAAGSLLEFALAEFEGSMPVGRIEFHHLGPVSFLEFVEELEGPSITEFVSSWKVGQTWPESVHQVLSNRLRDFLAVGAMPEAAALFSKTGDLLQAQSVHRSILETYREDFGKYSKGAEIEKIRRLFDAAPSNIGQKMRWSRINPSWKSVDLRRAFDQLERAGVVAGVRHSDGTGVPLGATVDDDVFKVLFLDVGLAQTAMGLPPMPMDDFRLGRFVNEGSIAEQFVGQHLRQRHQGRRPELHYWLREGKSGNAEVDFLVQVEGRIVPVEVKSGAAGSMRSLHQFMALRGGSLAVRFDLNPPTLQEVSTTAETPQGRKQVDYRLLSMPLYLAQRLEPILASLDIQNRE